MIKLTHLILIYFFLNSISVTQSQSLEDDDSNDFGTPNQTTQTNEEDDCALSKDSELINLLNFKLKKFNPTGKEFESGPPLTEEEIKHKSIRFYSLQLQDERSVKIDIDKFAPRLSFFFNSHLDFFEEVAKFRAARRIWARRMKEKYKAKDPQSWKLRFHAQTAGCSLTAQQPENNISRTAFQGLAAVLGGAQSLHTNSMDETLALPSEKAAEIALRTQQLIAF